MVLKKRLRCFRHSLAGTGIAGAMFLSMPSNWAKGAEPTSGRAVVDMHKTSSEGPAMADKTSTHLTESTFVAVIDKRTLQEIDRIAQKYGATREEILEELLRLELTERPKVATLH